VDGEGSAKFLIWRIEESPAIALHYNTEIASVDDDGNLECVSGRDGDTGQIVWLLSGSYTRC
jgi:hypothetical protein